MQTEAQRLWYINNADRHKANVKIRRDKHRKAIRKWIQELKSNTPCNDCNIKYPYFVMHFDHLDSSIKEIVISQAIERGWSKARIQKEIDKCEIVCANCHAIRTHERAL